MRDLPESGREAGRTTWLLPQTLVEPLAWRVLRAQGMPVWPSARRGWAQLGPSPGWVPSKYGLVRTLMGTTQFCLDAQCSWFWSVSTRLDLRRTDTPSLHPRNRPGCGPRRLDGAPCIPTQSGPAAATSSSFWRLAASAPNGRRKPTDRGPQSTGRKPVWTASCISPRITVLWIARRRFEMACWWHAIRTNLVEAAAWNGNVPSI